jgi:hypothetical protein
VCSNCPTRTSLDVAKQKRETRKAFQADNYVQFSTDLAQPHNTVHTPAGGCDLGVLATASYDPIFYLHHSYVDFQWAFWQETKGAFSSLGIPNDALTPFDRTEFNQNEKTRKTGQDLEHYRTNLCYEYENLLFDGKTPQEFVLTDSVPGDEELVEDSLNRRNQVLAGVALPHKSPSGSNIFQLCQEGNCVEGGRLSTFGSAKKPGDDYAGSLDINKQNFILMEADVTHVVKKQGWTLEKPLEVKMTDSVVKNLPQPVVIVKQKGADGKLGKGRVILSPKKKPADYGDLLDEYEKPPPKG